VLPFCRTIARKLNLDSRSRNAKHQARAVTGLPLCTDAPRQLCTRRLGSRDGNHAARKANRNSSVSGEAPVSANAALMIQARFSLDTHFSFVPSGALNPQVWMQYRP
jgi:hypothetical protein